MIILKNIIDNIETIEGISFSQLCITVSLYFVNGKNILNQVR